MNDPNETMTLGELLAALQTLAANEPETLDMPVWMRGGDGIYAVGTPLVFEDEVYL